ncbi:ribonuclease R [Mycoplasma phocoenae]|uniref:Ribonuclease R n=1 Tax=Mycoplasma phocoenae TaxID=754517 RepID=A0A858U6D1_9MOLU|nr:ribonuclease R [Mycoplasma phocoenae]QJG67017.1 ribonuclease R [Mycoplasma phocoenae]
MNAFDPKNIEKQTLEILSKSQKPYSFIELVKKINLKPKFNSDYSTLLWKMADERKIEKTREGNYFALKKLTNDNFKISLTAKRLGFIDFEENKSALVLPFELKGVLDGDIVNADICSYMQNGVELYRGYVNFVKQRGKTTLIGQFVKGFKNNLMYFEASDEKDNTKYTFNEPLKFEYKTDHFVKVSIDSVDLVKGRIPVSFIEYIGSVEAKGIIQKKIIAQNNVNEDFEPNVLETADLIPQEIRKEDYRDRKDITELLTVTIDGEDTKDFDDAISCEKLDNGTYKLWVHIADVSYYVKENDPIDSEALRRGTSIYLPDKVIPMLPFALSNGICSLNPGVERATLTLEMIIDQNGHTTHFDIYPAIIKSDYRLTYKQVNNYYDGNTELQETVNKLLNDAKELSEIIRKYKNEQGYVDFEISEPKIILKDDEVIDIEIKTPGFSESMIEDFMVRANETVATMMYKRKIPSIYRIHDIPSDEKLLNLQTLLNFLKINVKVPTSGKPADFAKAIQKIKEFQNDDFIKIFLLRTMQKAKYSEANIGHFGLASECYSHFTSPIRRYPDLLLHRLIRDYIFNNQSLNDEQKDELNEKVKQISISTSDTENVALVVERGVTDVRKAEFFQSFINKEFKATLITCEKFGIFFELDEYKTSVLVRYEEIENDNVIQLSTYEAKGKTKHFKVGETYRILITETDAIKGTVSAKILE